SIVSRAPAAVTPRTDALRRGCSSSSVSPRPPRSTLSPYTTLFRSEAERIKQKHGCALASMVSKDETIEVPSVGGRQNFDGLVLRSEEHTSELQSLTNLVCRLLLEKKKKWISNMQEGRERPKTHPYC